MVKTVKFLALSLLVPSLAIAMAPSTRDIAHAVAGAAEAYVQDTLGHKSKGLVIGQNPAVQDKAQAAFWSYVSNDAPNAIAYGTVHNQVVGPVINSQFLGQDGQVTFRDNTFRTLGNLAAHVYKGNNWQQSALTSVNPLYAYAAVKYLWNNRSSLTALAQADAQAVAAAYANATASVAPAAASKTAKK